MIETFDTDIVLVMREGLAIRTEHVDCMTRLGLRVHPVTPEQVEQDPRFASIHTVPGGLTVDGLADVTLDVLRASGSTCAVTFLDTDIAAVEQTTISTDRSSPGLNRIVALARPGQVLQLPPARHVAGRYGYIVTYGPTAAHCAQATELARPLIQLSARAEESTNA